ncbi:MAG: phospho-sugar mutase [Oscillospiraceae bacterium]|nr:phospho-sugar mutase [Oscillospiraceae bacterium]MCL2279057.1 phospho-sugar mutase [Oscillospiraceae bacterium]
MNYKEQYNRWLSSPALSKQEKEELRSIAGDEKEIESRFFGPLEFGTAGLRGIMAVGLFRMNIHIIRHTTQAFCELIKEEPAKDKCVAIGYDSRLNSDKFSKEAACIIAANGIKVRIFDALRPTPELSFAIREYGCIAGINVTASHNPKEYNGYKVYWSDGAQLPPHHAEEVAKKMSHLDMFDSIKTMDYDKALSDGLITIMGQETDEKFLKNVMEQANDYESVEKVADSFKLVYTPFHGAGYKLVPEALKRLGIKHILCEPQQSKIDGTFPTVVSPNPENPEGFELSIALAKKNGADLIIGTDPDCDRVGIMVRDDKGNYITLSGNQTGVLLLDYLIGAKTRTGKMPKNPASLKSLVTTEMARVISEKNGLACFDTFTGFKFMAEKKNALEAAGTHNVIYSYEESYGYMIGDFVRDKDAVTASMLLAEMAAWYAGQGMTLFDALLKLYEKYGQFAEKTLNLVMPGLDGLEKMKKLMADLRENPPEEIAGETVFMRRDYMSGTELDVKSGKTHEIELKGSNVLRYGMADSTAVIVRPSGTEPKVKVYILASGETQAACSEKVQKYEAWANKLAD